MSIPFKRKDGEKSHVTTPESLEDLQTATPSPLLLALIVNGPYSFHLDLCESQTSHADLPFPSKNPDSISTISYTYQFLSQFNAQITSPWDRQCECGGIPAHYHGRGRLHDMVNGINPPTGPRGDQNATAGPPTSPAATSPSTTAPPPAKRPGRLANHMQVAKTYVFEQEIQKCLRQNGVSQAREDSLRLGGVQWIDNVRRALKL